MWTINIRPSKAGTTPLNLSKSAEWGYILPHFGLHFYNIFLKADFHGTRGELL